MKKATCIFRSRLSRCTRVGAGLLAMLASVLLLTCGRPSSAPAREVVVYVSEDQVFSEPILKEFERETGIRVRAVYDTEEAKSAGVMNRLLAEAAHPQADVYWANEPIRAELLRQKGVLAPYVSPAAREIPATFKDPEGNWTGFSARARVLLVNSRTAESPASVRAYANPKWKGRAVIANPLFGTTTAQVAALFIVWGDEAAKNFLSAMKDNGVKLSTSNGESADLVAAGEFDFSLVDSDDAVNRARQGRPVRMIYPDQGEGEPGCLIVPNAAMIIRNCPHPETARQLVDWLLSPETERKLAAADCAQIPLHPGVPVPADVPQIEKIRTMQVNYAEVARKMAEIQPFLQTWARD